MSEILFNIGQENGVPDSSARLVIPDEGKLPVIPCQWQGQPLRRVLISTISRQPENNAPRLETVSNNSTNLVWIPRRQQWVAFEESWNYGHTDNYGFSDDDLTLKGPWLLDTSCKLAVLQAYGRNISPQSDVSLVDEIAPRKWEFRALSTEAILQDERDQREKALKTPAEEVYLMTLASMYPSGGSGDFQLRELVRVLTRINRYNGPELIELTGWRREGEHHGGYEYTESSRDDLGTGRLLYRGKTPKDITVEIWQAQIQESKRALVLAIKSTVTSGYVGIDNHYGTDYRWEVVGMRTFIIPSCF